MALSSALPDSTQVLRFFSLSLFIGRYQTNYYDALGMCDIDENDIDIFWDLADN